MAVFLAASVDPHGFWDKCSVLEQERIRDLQGYHQHEFQNSFKSKYMRHHHHGKFVIHNDWGSMGGSQDIKGLEEREVGVSVLVNQYISPCRT